MAVQEEASLSIIVRARDEAMQILQNLGGTLRGLGPAALAGTAIGVAALAGLGLASLKMAGDFQSATMAIVTGAGEDVKNLELIRQGLLRLAPEVGKTPKELADGLYFIESAGYHGAQGLDVLRVAAIAAKVGQADMAVVSDALTSALNAYNIPARNAANVTDILIQTVALGKMHMSDLASNIGKVLPVASTAGIGLREMGAAIATMTMQGTDAAMATTSLRFLISNLEAPTKQATTALKEIGLSAGDLFAALKDPNRGLHGALELITSHINTKFTPGSQQAVEALKAIAGGTRGLTGALELTGTHMATFKGNLDSINAASSGTGKTMEGWKLVQGDFNTQWDRFTAGVQVAIIQLGTNLLPIGTQVLAWLSTMLPIVISVVGNIAGFVGGVVELGNRLGILLPIISAVVGTMIIMQGISLATTLIGLIGPVMGAIAAFGSLAASEGILAAVTLITISPFLLIAIAIAAVIAIGVFLIMHWNQVQAVAREVGKVVTEAIGAAFAFIQNAIADALKFLTATWTAIVKVFTDSVNNVVAWITAEIPKIPQQIGFALGFAIGTVIKFGIDLYREVTTAVPMAIGAVVSFFAALPGRVWDILVDLFNRWLQFERDLGAFILRAIPAAVNAIVNFFAELPGRVWGFLLGLAQAVFNIVPRLAEGGASAGSSLLNALWNGIVALPGMVVGLGEDIVRGIWRGIQNLAGWLTSMAKNFAGGIVDGIKSAMGIKSPSTVTETEIGEPIILGVVQGISNQAWRIRDAVVNAIPKANTLGSGGPSGLGSALSGSLVPAVVPSAASPAAAGFLGGGNLVIPVMLNGREIGRAVMSELELQRRLRGGNLAGGA